MSKNVIITGANGFVGSWLCKELVENNYHVYAVVRNKHSNVSEVENLKNLDIIYCNIHSLYKLPRMIDVECDLFFHLAWEGSAGDDRGDCGVQLSNIEASCSAVEIAKLCGCKRFVHAGSLMEYEAANYLFANNTMPTKAYIYKTSKLASDFMSRTIAQSIGIDYINVVISNTYGTGEISPRFISSFLRRMLRGEECNLTSCVQMYDFIYISDAVRAIRLSAEKGKTNNNYYIGNKRQYPLKDFIIKMKSITNSKCILNFGAIPYDGIMIDYAIMNPSRIFDEFGFEIQISFEEGIKKTVAWIEKNE